MNSPSVAAVELHQVSKSFAGPQRVHALRDVSVRIERNEMVAVIGPSGSGKSTLLNMIGLLDSPDHGTIKVLGQNVEYGADRDLTRLRSRRIGFVFQNFHLLRHESAQRNVELPLIYQGISKRARQARARAALEAVRLSHRIEALPRNLSGGECQRVAIARALVTRPEVLLCDEPTGNLDSVNATAIVSLLRELVADGERAVVVVTHDPDVARSANRVVQLRDGRVVSDSSSDLDAHG